jgi:hypothetical protein
MKKLVFLLLILGMSFTLDLSAQGYDPLGGYGENVNEHCGPVYGGPQEDECTSDFSLYVYYPLYVECTCEARICLGWFTPGETYNLPVDEQSIAERAFSWVVYGELNYWVAVHGDITETDREVTLSDFVWETKPPPLVWNFVPEGNPVTGELFKDFMLDGFGISGVLGYRYFRAYCNTVTVGPGAHGFYDFTGTLEAHYNF